ncbi:hypothetical protein IY145_21685 [Methylosinus sp. H3A]|uniref:hypothetical protein n=1 Tax=Methylosinus sp. H3A TaxID=2785786 RepID=UPI0018C2BF71|nr:hypothetical protein [Methylosinus sp. H3A]MBG0811957.1 hypothetical protein [Methylosinus sp. H3A]
MTQAASDNSTKVATTAFFVAQLGIPHTWSALQTFSGGISAVNIGLTAGGVFGANLDATFTHYLGHGMSEFTNYFTIVPYFSRYVGNNSGTGGEVASAVEYQRVYEDGAVMFFGQLSMNTAKLAGFLVSEFPTCNAGAGGTESYVTDGDAGLRGARRSLIPAPAQRRINYGATR